MWRMRPQLPGGGRFRSGRRGLRDSNNKQHAGNKNFRLLLFHRPVRIE
jgi:hypothetical protein